MFVKNRFCHFRTFPWLLKKYAKSKQIFSEIRSLYICVAIFIILESLSEKLWDQNYKLHSQNYKLYAHKTTSYAHKITSYAHKTTSYAHKTTSYEFKTYKFDG